jgi:DNA-binding HxlR family transcriptional regulator
MENIGTMRKKGNICMKAWSDIGTLCPITRSQTLVGDRWSVVILRELLMGAHRFEEIQAQTGATPQMLTSRLKKLQTQGLVKRKAYSKRPLRYDYFLTNMGRDFLPVILALRAWGEAWCKSKREPLAMHLTHILCDGDPGFGTLCKSCGETLRYGDLKGKPSPAYAREREKRRSAFKASRL